MPRSRSRKGRKSYRPRDFTGALAVKDGRDHKNELRKIGLPLIGGEGSWDLSMAMLEGKDKYIPDNPELLPRKARRFGLKKGLLGYDESGKLIKVTEK
jgi:hypothetical protein